MPRDFDVTFLLVAGEKNLEYHAEVLAAAKHASLRVETILVETNERACLEARRLADQFFDRSETPWIGPAHEVAVAHARAPVYFYMCNHHMTFRKPSWLADLVHPAMEGVDLVGQLREHGFGPAALPGLQWLSDSNPAYRVHIQGGIWAGHTHAIPKYLAAYPHGYEDVVRSWLMWHQKRTRVDPGVVFSTGVRGQVCPSDARYSVIHDYRLGAP